MEEQIKHQLANLEQRYGVTALYACESGSRAWGFESTDSDYDVRFIYQHPKSWYLSVAPQADTIECKISAELDFSGWDIRKALGLFRKCNPSLFEWLQSPTVYRYPTRAISDLKDLMPQYFNPKASFYHYYHMASGNLREYLEGEEVKLKKYFYVLRPVLACMWLEQERGIVPMKFEDLYIVIGDRHELLAAINDLVARKKSGEELSRGKRIPVIGGFLEERMKKYDQEFKGYTNESPGFAPLDTILRESLG